ncbi:hypothetical protein LOZ65_002168 [Ophidiomyces ophidiicola]|nr:hypothetical protein LOZ65_002168 [Ophidiomyces ophidiicola]
MEPYRAAAKKELERIHTDNVFSLNLDSCPIPGISLADLWHDIRTQHNLDTDTNISENFLITQLVLETVENPFPDGQIEAANALISWISAVILPSDTFEGAWEESQLSIDEAKEDIFDRYKPARIKAALGLEALKRIWKLLSINRIEDHVKVIATLAAFTDLQDPWTSVTAFSSATLLLNEYKESYRAKDEQLPALFGEILARYVKPSFSKTRTPALTSAGRKDMHPLKQPKFDPSLFGKGSKPWKYTNNFVLTILSWVVGQYTPSDRATIEGQFPLLVPAILSLIDDESLPYKALGCRILYQLLIPLEQTKSDILKRTNLDSVFEDALSPCLLSLPTITPEEQSIHLLKFAYPALFSVITTRFPLSPPSKEFYSPAPSHRKTEAQEAQSRLICLTKLLRQGIISSYSHISISQPSEDTYISSFPYPRLSTLLLTQLATAIREMALDSIKHLQEIVPILTSTLTNPFGTAYIPLLIAAIDSMLQLILSAWLRIWKWRADILAGLCGCWLQIKMDESSGSITAETIGLLKARMTECVEALRITLEESNIVDETGEKIYFQDELQNLMSSDERLIDLLSYRSC